MPRCGARWRGWTGRADALGRHPGRPFLGLSDDDRSAILDIVAEWMETSAADAL